MILLNPAHRVKNTWLNSNKEEQTRIISQAWKTKGKREFIGREGKLRRWRRSLQRHKMTNLTACNKGASVHRKKKKKEDVRPTTCPSFKHKQSPSKLSKPSLAPPTSPWASKFTVDTSNRCSQGEKCCWRCKGEGAGVGPAWTDFTVGGGRLLYSWFPCSQQLHFHKLWGGKSREGGRGGQQQNRGGCGGSERERKREKAGPQSIKGC